MTVIVHDNRARFKDNQWCMPYSITVRGLVVWSGFSISEIPNNTLRELEAAAPEASLYELIQKGKE